MHEKNVCFRVRVVSHFIIPFFLCVLVHRFVDLSHLRVLSHSDTIVSIDLHAHVDVDDASSIGVKASVVDGGAEILGSVDSAVSWNKPLDREWETDGHFKASSAVHSPLVSWDVEALLNYESSAFVASVSSNHARLFGSDGSFGLSDVMW